MEGVGGTFDYGDLGSGLQFEDAPMDLGAGPMAGGGGMGADAPMQFGGPPAEGPGDLQLEEPMSAFQPDSPPGWMAGPPADEAMDLAAPTVAEPEAPVSRPAGGPARPRREPRDRPPAPKFKSQRSLAGPIVTVVVLGALGVGGYLGWPIL